VATATNPNFHLRCHLVVDQLPHELEYRFEASIPFGVPGSSPLNKREPDDFPFREGRHKMILLPASISLCGKTLPPNSGRGTTRFAPNEKTTRANETEQASKRRWVACSSGRSPPFSDAAVWEAFCFRSLLCEYRHSANEPKESPHPSAPPKGGSGDDEIRATATTRSIRSSQKIKFHVPLFSYLEILRVVELLVHVRHDQFDELIDGVLLIRLILCLLLYKATM